MLNVEKVIRLLGYIVYVILWLPVILVGLVVFPIIALLFAIKYRLGVKAIMQAYLKLLKAGFNHDINFIQTGIW